MLSEYVGIGLLMGMVMTTAVVMLIVSQLFGPKKHRPRKVETYESGKPLFTSARRRLSIHFYLVAIVFILFDVEVLFLVPWAVLFQELGTAGLVEMALFIAVLGVAWVYLWKKGALDVKTRSPRRHALGKINMSGESAR